jgi:hypothetical protein
VDVVGVDADRPQLGEGGVDLGRLGQHAAVDELVAGLGDEEGVSGQLAAAVQALRQLQVQQALEAVGRQGRQRHVAHQGGEVADGHARLAAQAHDAFEFAQGHRQRTRLAGVVAAPHAGRARHLETRSHPAQRHRAHRVMSEIQSEQRA